MVCYECQQAGKSRDAVALCHHCSDNYREEATAPAVTARVQEEYAVSA